MKSFRKRITSIFLVGFFVVLSFAEPLWKYDVVLAEGTEANTAKVRLIFTTDNHGQLTDTDYELGTAYKKGSLAKAYTLIKEARAEAGEENCYTFDVGDSFYDYTTERMFAEDATALQPIYKGLSLVGYDAITLGNHDFDYGYQFILNQLDKSGLRNISIVSNVMDSKTGEHIFGDSKIIEKEIETSDGTKTKIKVGVIGETIPNLTNKTESYVGILKTEDIVENAKAHAQKLKKQGADVIVVLSHSGFGPEDPVEKYKNVTYALSKIPEVDVILCGHEHNMFPSTDASSAAYYTLPGVDKETGLVNGKRVVMSSDKGKSIGVVDLDFDVKNQKNTLTATTGEVRRVDAEKTQADPVLNSLMGEWHDIFLKSSKTEIGQVEDGKRLENYFGIVEDSAIMQLLNNSKIRYGKKYITTENTAYKDYPVVAISKYFCYGEDSADDYLDISKSILEGKLASVQPYNKYIAIFTITGAQLKEWLEWSASAYAVPGSSNDEEWSHYDMMQYMQEQNVPCLLEEEWLNDWDSFYICDGVEYTIDPTKQPRYNKKGDKISESSRIASFTLNGVPIDEKQTFILVADRITELVDVTREIDTQAVVKGFNRSQTVLADYIKEMSQLGTIKPETDHNWKLLLPEDYRFLYHTSENAASLAKEKKWIESELGTSGSYNYYLGKAVEEKKDEDAPNLVLVSTNELPTNRNVKVVVHATDTSGIGALKYCYGIYDEKSDIWNSATDISKDACFEADKNGVYSVYAKDIHGNERVEEIVILNMNKEILEIPKVSSYDNNDANIKGSAEPGATLFFVAAGKTYESVVNLDGSFSYPLPNQKSGSVIEVYVKDQFGRESDRKKVTVKRAGPNYPTVKEIANNVSKITGETNDTDADVFAIIGSNVYVAKSGGEEYYTSCKVYDSNKTIKKVNIVLDKKGAFQIPIPVQNANKKISIYTVDHLGRVSRCNKATVADKAPNKPTVYEVCEKEQALTGKVTSASGGTLFSVTITLGDNTFKGNTDEDGEFCIPVGVIKKKDKLTVVASDKVGKTTRKSASVSVEVKGISEILSRATSKKLEFDEITNKLLDISGMYSKKDSDIILNINDKVYKLKSSQAGDFEFILKNTLKAGTIVYAVARDGNGTIYAAAKKKVVADIPDQPKILTNITNSTTEVQVTSEELCTVTLKGANGILVSKKGVYNKEYKGYVYKFFIPRTNAGKKIKVYAQNTIGSSITASKTVQKAAPEPPKLDKVYEEEKSITGKVELFLQMGKDDLKPKTPTVSNTGTKVYVKIGKKTYQAKIKKDGTFKVKIPKQKAGKKIIVWAKNKEGGCGPEKSLLVKKKAKTKK